MRPRLVSVVAGVAAALGVVVAARCSPDVVPLYEDKLRGSMFSGFLTFAGFLFSATTFIVVKMKEALYSTDMYRARVREQRATAQSSAPFYGPLDELRSLLLGSVAVCFATALLQVTLGLWASTLSAAVNIGMAVLSLTLVAHALYLLNQNLRIWFRYLEEEESKR